jgi:phosphoglycolate phosphatase
MKKLVIFDLDGTLLDTIEDLGNATNHALRSLGFPERTREEYYRLVGRGITNLFKGAVPAGCDTPETIGRMRELFLAHYGKHLCDFTHPYPGIMELLEHITARGVRIAVASNKYQEGAETVIRHFFGDFSFTALLGQQEGFPLKPDPEIVELCRRAAGVEKEDILYTGDSNVDMQTGKNAGVDTVGVTWGFRSREELEAFHPLAVVDTAEELERLILTA